MRIFDNFSQKTTKGSTDLDINQNQKQKTKNQNEF